jgi:PAS domain S-box-containing protein
LSTNHASSIVRPKGLIRTKLIVSAAITIGLALAVAVTVSLQYRNITQAARTERFAHEVIKSVSDLNSLGYTYLLLKDERPRAQWRLKHGSLGKLLSEQVLTTPDEQALIVRLRSSLVTMKGLFDVLVKGAEEGIKDAKGTVSPYDELNEGVVAQLMARSEIMVNDASLLGRESAARMDAVVLRSFFLVLISACMLIISAIVTASLLVTKIGGSIRALTQGTHRIAAGDLAYRLEMPANDELGELGRAFDDMSERLQEVTVSKDRLAEEVEERKRAEEALRKAHDEMELRVEERTAEVRRQADLIQLSHEAIIVRDLDSRIVFWNKGAEETYGWTKEDALGNVIHSFLKTRWPVPFDEQMAELTREGRWEGEIIHTRKDGSTLTELSRQVLQNDEAGRPSAILEINIDITERKRAEDETRKHAVRLEVSNRELQDFAFVASHDLQEPLRKIQAFGDQLKAHCGGSFDDEGADYLNRMQGAAARMQALIHSLLNYSRVTTRGKPFVRTDLSAVAREAAGNVEVTIKETGGRVEIDELAIIDADPVQMGQLFQNLIGNALKFHGKERPVVKVYGLSDRDEEKGRSHHREYRIVVEDNGIGFDEKYLDRIFTPFQRLHGRGAYAGTGIGLAICKKIVDRHGGTITAKSTPGKGATFIVALPLNQSKGEKE